MKFAPYHQILCGMAALFLAYSSAGFAFDALQPLPPTPIIPQDNPQSAAKIELGKQLFFDTRLSADGTLSCNSCHNLAAGGDDDGAAPILSKGMLDRSAPSVYNSGHMSVAYWDSRETSLEAQTVEHILDQRVMGMGAPGNVVSRIASVPGYVDAFDKVFGSRNPLTMENLAKALASFERSLNTPDSAFDRFIKGEKNAISAAAKRGLTLFTDSGCLSCHFGVNFAGPAPGPALKMGDGFYELFPNHPGSIYDKKYGIADDLGLYEITLEPGHKRLFRVPSLRNVADTAPYFHNGSVNSLEEAVRVMALTQLRLRFDQQQISDIVAFLQTLTGEYPNLSLPRLPETTGATLTGQYRPR